MEELFNCKIEHRFTADEGNQYYIEHKETEQSFHVLYQYEAYKVAKLLEVGYKLGKISELLWEP